MSRLIQSFGYEWVPKYSWVFPNDQTAPEGTIFPKGGWFGPDCKPNGFVDRDKVNKCIRENFDYACLMLRGWVVKTQTREIVPGIIKCDCGQELENWQPGGDVDCHCGLSYNSAGQRLAPRSQWGEETGETAEDYDRGFANPDAAFRED